MRKILLFLFMILIFCGSAFAIITHCGDVQINQTYVTNNNTYYTNDTLWSITGNYLFNNSGDLDINESYLNNTIDARAVAGSGNTTAEMRNAVNSSIYYDLEVNCSNIWFTSGMGSATICDGVDDAGTGGAGYNATDGTLNATGTTLGVNTSYIQRRVSGSCGAGNSIREIAIDGSVTCEADTDTDTDTQLSQAQVWAYMNVSKQFILLVNYSNILQFPDFVLESELVGKVGNWTDDKSDYYTSAQVDGFGFVSNATMNTSIDCSDIHFDTGFGSATICDGVDDAGAGGAGFNTTDYSLNYTSTKIGANTSYLQKRIIDNCSAGYSIRAIDINGNVTCEEDTDTNTQLSQADVWTYMNVSKQFILLVNYSNILQFPDFVLESELVGKVGNWTDDKSDYYTSAQVDGFGFVSNATMNTSIDCSDIASATSNLCTLEDTDTDTNETPRVDALYSNASTWNDAYNWGDHSLEGYITDGNDGWDNSYLFITNATMNTSIDCSDIASATSDLCTLEDTNTQLTEEQVTDYAGGMWTGNTETGITITFEDSDNTIDAVVDFSSVDECSEITGCVENAVTNLTMNTSIDWSDLVSIPTGFADGIDNGTTLTEPEVEAYVSIMPIDINMTDNGIRFDNGSYHWRMYVNASGYLIIEEI